MSARDDRLRTEWLVAMDEYDAEYRRQLERFSQRSKIDTEILEGDKRLDMLYPRVRSIERERRESRNADN